MTERDDLEGRFDSLKGANLHLDLTRGKPAAEQLDLADELDGCLGGDYVAEDGTDVRNYGMLRGLPEARALGARLLDVAPDEVIAGGNASLTLMFFVLDAAMNTGLTGTPWRAAGQVKCLCPVPGYDRHFALADALGMQLVTVPMTDAGPDMDVVEDLVTNDADVRCIWCVPKYSNPTGCIYSEETVRRLAELPRRHARNDQQPFLVLWDNAYTVHDFTFPPPRLTPILPLAKAAGTEDSIAMFASTSKITFAGGGISFVGGSANFLDAVEKRLSILMVGPDKVNQLRHARFLTRDRLETHMRAHAEIVRPKFEAVQRGLKRGLGGTGLATWTDPKGGYFVSLDTRPGLAKAVVALAGELGVALTPAGATFPHGHDPADRNIRIAPTLATLQEVESGIDVLSLCVKVAAARQSNPA
ncbi:MAG: aminotransferase class I/II-fold pyridoxal phosphate-dependent enzyme [Gammaproteobacteria bacterium]|nr:aminotransferase class I/II-fold pyridoxal phosphate-dependent enzyme [Gammaproteobacteria bacterium]